MNILGIHDGHNASAALLVDGRIVACVQEERFRNEKNYMGFPENAISWVLEAAGLDCEDLDLVAAATVHQPQTYDVKKIRDAFRKEQKHLARSRVLLLGRNTPLYKIYRWRLKGERMGKFEKAGLAKCSLRFVEHHLCHAASAYFGSPWRDRVLVLTLDGGGDGFSATVSVGSGSSLERIAGTSESDSLGNIYSRVTFMLGFVPWEHEYKIMGMAPYASGTHSARLEKELKSCIALSPKNPLVFKRSIPEPTHLIAPRLNASFQYERFDHIASALQRCTEELIMRWVREAVSRTGIRKLALAGGVFMNVKANKVIAEIPEVEDVFVFPSCGDESNAVGAAYWAYAEATEKTPDPVGPIYWGPDFSASDEEGIVREAARDGSFEHEEIREIEDVVADLLIEHKIVARVADRMEFGARALGNRSILADPRDLVNVQVINRMIKMRDFWMPFAPVVLAESQDNYLCRTKPIRSPYMMFAFDTQPSRRSDIIAAVHQADGTARPQVIEKEYNPAYHHILLRFEKSTGRGALLNTSFNLHGYPIALGPREALWVFKNSGLEYLALGHHLLRKKRISSDT